MTTTEASHARRRDVSAETWTAAILELEYRVRRRPSPAGAALAGAASTCNTT